ncbi:MAG TPA: type II toxin-antitoxin system HigB family toxin [Prolixibacteraceae bacterium]|nr:type II toxin-antitoxin system HigB family toxin [Prolixibacteraceae bacterium]
MRIVTYKRILDFCERYPDANVALQLWYHKSSNSEWHNLSDIKRTFGTVDYAGNNRYVFNIKGNNYRIVVIIIFVSQKIYIRFIGTHTEYDKIDCSTI